MRLSLTALLSLAAVALSADVTLYLGTKPNPFTLPPSTHATLSSLHKHLRAPLSAANTFVFHNVTPDSYLADVHCPTDGFQPLRIDVAADGSFAAWETYRGNEWGNKGEALPIMDGSVSKGVEVRALGGKLYFLERPTCEFLVPLKNAPILFLRKVYPCTDSVMRNNSLRLEHSQEPYDPHGSCHHGNSLWHALPDG